MDQELEEHLRSMGAVCVEGPKWCGKTWTSEMHAASKFEVALADGNFANRQLAELSPSAILAGDLPRMIDEWQDVPAIWDAVRSKVDETGQKGQFILTGSATPKYKGIMHSGAGRIARIRMRPMSLYESKDSSGLISLEQLCRGNFEPVYTGKISLDTIIQLIVRGGWPGSLDLPFSDAAHFPAQYIKSVLEEDIHKVDGKHRDMKKMERLLHSLARNESKTVSIKALKRDIQEVDEETIDEDTISSYLDVLRRIFLLEDTPPFSTKVRSTLRLKKADKRHFTDPSLPCAVLGLTPEKLLKDLETLGFLFESLVERDLGIYAQSFGARLYHYQDYNSREIDAVIELSDGDWAAFEIKLGANQIDAAAKNLLTIKKQIENDPKGIPPKVLGVICGMTTAAYQREDGVYVVPITALKN